MQGRTESSLSIWTAFNNLTTASSRPVRWTLNISWTRVQGNVSYATVGTSLVGGIDIIQGNTDVVTSPDNFTYFDETDRLIKLDYDRILIEPLGGISSTIMDCELNNFDGRFTPQSNGTIGTAILPNRPLTAHIGFFMEGIKKTVPIFKGLTEMPEESKASGKIKIHAVDFVKFLQTATLDGKTYVDNRTDAIISDILITAGFASDQFVTETGLNTVGYAYFNKDQSAFDRIKLLCEAEEGLFYQDENGVLRFETRRHFIAPPHNTSVWDINSDDIIQWEERQRQKIYNHVIVKSLPREVQATAVIWTSGSEVRVKANETKDVWARLDDPATELTTLATPTDYTAFTGTAGGGSDISGDQSIVQSLLGTDVKLSITNNNASDAFFNLLQIRGKAATVVGDFTEEATDTVSINKFDIHELSLENDFIQDESFAAYMAQSLVDKYGQPGRVLRLLVQGIPQIQLRDRVKVTDIVTNVIKEYRVMRIQGMLEGGGFLQYLTIREITSFESQAFAVVGSTLVGATEEFVGI